MRKALLIMWRDGGLTRVGLPQSGQIYRGKSFDNIKQETIIALGERFLATIIIEGRVKPARYIARCTELGELVAKALAQIEKETPLAPDDIDGCTEVYQEPEEEAR
jgi:hypothetical protein